MVNEQETIPQKTAGDTTPDIKAGDVVPTASLLERADALRKGLEETEKRIKEHIDRFENIAARQLLSGRSEAGTVNKTPEQINKEETDRQSAEIVKRFHR